MSEQLNLGSNEVICQKWEESEAGWGVRPDGFSLHVSIQAMKIYIRDYWAQLPNNPPESYSRPAGMPYPLGVAVSVIDEIKAAGNSLRYDSNYDYPGSGGVDGWMPRR